jgi:hypothetical protein
MEVHDQNIIGYYAMHQEVRNMYESFELENTIPGILLNLLHVIPPIEHAVMKAASTLLEFSWSDSLSACLIVLLSWQI